MNITDEIIKNKIENIPELYGVSEFGRMIGWKRKKVHTYSERGKLPKSENISLS